MVLEIGEKDLAETLGVSARRVRQMAQEGLVIKTSKGKYDLKQSVNNYIENLKSKNKNNTETLEKIKLSKEAELLMHEKLKKRKTELTVLEIEKKMHRAEDVEAIWNIMVFNAKSKITAIPTKIAPQLVGIEDVKEIQSILKRETNECLNEISNYDVTDFDKDFDESIDNDE